MQGITGVQGVYGATGPTTYSHPSTISLDNIETLDYNKHYYIAYTYAKHVSPIHIFIFFKEEFIKRFNEIKDDVNKPISTGEVPLDIVGDIEVAQLLIDNGAKISSRFCNKDINIIELLIDNGYTLEELKIQNDPMYKKLFELKIQNKELKKIKNFSLESVVKHTIQKYT